MIWSQVIMTTTKPSVVCSLVTISIHVWWMEYDWLCGRTTLEEYMIEIYIPKTLIYITWNAAFKICIIHITGDRFGIYSFSHKSNCDTYGMVLLRGFMVVILNLRTQLAAYLANLTGTALRWQSLWGLDISPPGVAVPTPRDCNNTPSH